MVPASYAQIIQELQLMVLNVFQMFVIRYKAYKKMEHVQIVHPIKDNKVMEEGAAPIFVRIGKNYWKMMKVYK